MPRPKSILRKYSEKARKPPKLQTHKASGLAFVRSVLINSGRSIYMGKAGSAEAQAKYEEFCLRWQASQLATTRPELVPVAGRATTVTEVIAAYIPWMLEYFANDKHRREINHYRRAFSSLRRVAGSQYIAEFGPVALKAVRQDLIDRGLSRSTINAQIGRLKRFLSWGVENELVPASVYAACEHVAPLRQGKTTAREASKVRAVPWDRVELTKGYLSPMLAAMVTVHQHTGMRSGDVCIMRTADIQRTGQVWIYSPRSHKTQWRGKAKAVVLGPKSQEAITPWLMPDEPESFVWSPAKSMRSAGQTPRKKLKARYDAISYHHAIRNAFAKAERKDKICILKWHPHQLRHALATLVRERCGIEAAKAVLGNTIEATQIYAAHDASLAARVMGELG